jgi:hypothetical protein
VVDSGRAEALLGSEEPDIESIPGAPSSWGGCMRALAISLLCGTIYVGPLWAQHEHAGSPYAGEEASEIPSLTTRQLDGLHRGEGMGMAKPAELNHYPGPKHVLDLAVDLRLSQEQRAEIERIRNAMLSEAIRIGERIIEGEAELNRRFAHGHIDELILEELSTQIAAHYGELRFVHLAAHLSTRAVLTADQIATYDHLRGYSLGPSGQGNSFH